MMFHLHSHFWCLALAASLFLSGDSCRNSGAQTNSVNPTVVNSNQSQTGSADRAIQNGRALENGVWGGQGVSLEIKDGSAEIEYDCAHGTISGKIVPDRAGNFVVKGFHSREHGGPVREEETRAGEPVTYEGSVSGETMTLKVTEDKSKADIGNYTLTRGKSGRLRKCL
jgi:hypothetical protein